MFVAGFVGLPSMNLLPVTVKGEGDKPFASFGQVDGGQGKLILLQESLVKKPNREIILGIRLEAITDADHSDRIRKVIHIDEAKIE